MSILIKNGTIVDGSGSDCFVGNVLIEDDVIKYIGSDDKSASFVLDASGLVVCPGFIDTHSHSDLKILEEPLVLPKVMQGITTEVLGQDGISMAPLPLEYISAWRKNLAGLDGVSDNINWEYETVDNYLNMINPGVNVSYLVPHGNIRMEAMGLDDRLATKDDIEKMKIILRREMESGAFGLSTGLIYMPCAYGQVDEIIELCKVVAEYDGVFVVHQRSEADSILESQKELLKIASESGVRLHISHYKVCGIENWDKLDACIKMLEDGVASGLKISIDQYPYVAGSTMLGVVLPPWVHDGGTDRVLERLKDDTLREKMKNDILNGIEGWDNFIAFAGFDQIFITSVKYDESVVGLSLEQLAKVRNTDCFTATFDLLLSEENAVGMIDFYGKEEHVKKIMSNSLTNICTDGLLSGSKPHPRLYGTFPRVIGKYCRDEKVFSLEECIYKMTKKAALSQGIVGRGELTVGNFADLVIFNYNNIIDKATFDEPCVYPSGIKYVIVNGCIIVENGVHNKKCCGRVLRRNYGK